MNKTISWFEIPALDLNRATRFYEQVLAVTLNRGDMEFSSLAVFPYDREHSTGGCLMQGPGLRPSTAGAILYLNANPSIQAVLDRVPAAGGKVVLSRTQLPAGMGAFAHFLDSEGNRIGIHADA
jgi:predicted enzyme related to lactoylglutathione lyase